jgi:hypothetical protein
MSGLLRTSRLRTGLVLVVLVVAVAIGSTMLRGRDSAPLRVAATATPISNELAIETLVLRFIEALRAGDADTLYALQAESYKRVCSRQDFGPMVAALKKQQLEGPTNIKVQGDVAAAQVNERLADGSTSQGIIPLTREVDGSWRLAPPSSAGCVP